MKISLDFFFFYIFNIFSQNSDCGHTLGEAVLTCTHNQCFELEIRKTGTPQQTPVFFFYMKVGFNGVYFSWTCFPDGCTECTAVPFFSLFFRGIGYCKMRTDIEPIEYA